MDELLEGRLAQEQIVALLISLRAKGEAVEELVGFARAMRRAGRTIARRSGANFAAGGHLRHGRRWRRHIQRLDGGGAGRGGRGRARRQARQPLVQFALRLGRRARGAGREDRYHARSGRSQPSSRSASGSSLRPTMHTAMRHAAAARREVGGRTVFNLLGPLTNPAGATAQVIGVPAPALVEKLGHALAELETQHAFVVHGVDGIDEISLSDETEVAEVRPHSVQRYRVKPQDFGWLPARREELAGGDAAANAKIIRGIFEGERGPRRDFVCINAAAALVAAGRAPNFRKGARLAAKAIDSGLARAKLTGADRIFAHIAD